MVKEGQVIFTAHAVKRLKSRFPELTTNEAAKLFLGCRYRQTTRKEKREIADKCGYKGKVIHQFRGVYYRISKQGIVFVVAPQPTTIITLFRR